MRELHVVPHSQTGITDEICSTLPMKKLVYYVMSCRSKTSAKIFKVSRRVSPAVSGFKFDTAHRKKASPNIFENINQDVLVKLFEKAGDLKAVERAKSIIALHHDPEGISKALMALQQDKKDTFMLITGLTRQSLKFR
ncbi:hypothetical protein Q8A67_023820 [Cirrhinus molitorella]|uniref:Arginine vasopressin-induced protein 1/transcriptional and immune response regulator domain-containing protein n=1 Tax=Cirrhinus molitorella TaxID=172907 RepID=A0AA88P894_9TELE|nr:hypothetical protein Q8A67_023820 [Cirrhinus molitorella]